MSNTAVTTKIIDNDTKFVDGSDLDLIGAVELDSGDMASLIVGIYEYDLPQPDFHITVEPETVAISSTLVRVDDNGEYKLTYHFQNFQDSSCKVTVRRCDD